MTSTRIRMFGWRAGVVGLQRALSFVLALTLLVAGATSCRDKAAKADVAKEVAAPARQTDTSQVTVVNAEALADLLKASRGSVLVVNFWATWCKPCVSEMPELVGFYRENASDPAGEVTFISVSADVPGSLKKNVEPYLRKHSIPFPVNVIDAQSPDEVVQGLNLEDSGWDGALPATFVFDAKGLLRKAWFTEVTREELLQTVKSLKARAAQHARSQT